MLTKRQQLGVLLLHMTGMCLSQLNIMYLLHVLTFYAVFHLISLLIPHEWSVLALIIYYFSRYMEPLHSGAYPAVMVQKVGARLPKFSKSESLMLKGSFDFIGLNYYTSNYAADTPCQHEKPTYYADSCVRSTSKQWRWTLYIPPPTLIWFANSFAYWWFLLVFSCKKWSCHWSKGISPGDHLYLV